MIVIVHKSKRFTNTWWSLCTNYEDYLNFAKEMYQWKGEDVIFGGEQFQTEDSSFDSVSSWMDTFEVPYVLENPNDKYSDEHEIDNPLTDEYEIKNKPEENEYPVVVYMYKVQGYFNIDWFSIKELEIEDK